MSLFLSCYMGTVSDLLSRCLVLLSIASIKKYVYVDYLSLQREQKKLSSRKGFEDTPFDDLSGIGIPKTILNIVSCYDSSRRQFNNDIDVQNQDSVLLSIQRFSDA